MKQADHIFGITALLFVSIARVTQNLTSTLIDAELLMQVIVHVSTALRLSFILQVNPDHKNAPPGWLFGECNGKSGLFPENYAEKLSDQLAATKDTGKVESSPQSVITIGSNVAQLRQTLKLGLVGGKTAPEPVSSEVC